MPFYIVEREREWERQFEQETLELSEAIKTTNTAFIFWFLSEVNSYFTFQYPPTTIGTVSITTCTGSGVFMCIFPPVELPPVSPLQRYISGDKLLFSGSLLHVFEEEIFICSGKTKIFC